MVDEPHAVVQLLLKRMESHPEEFKCADDVHSDRWEEYVTGIEVHGNEADKAAIRAGMRDIRLAEIHEQVMDELMNGPERRAKEAEERELILKSALAQQQAAQQHQHYGWERNKGYGTPDHLAALRLHGPTPLHRKSFAPVSQMLLL